MSEYGRVKNTNIPWIGPIPDSWTFDRVGRTTYVKGRIGWKNLRSEDFIDEGPFLITGQDFQSGKVNWESCYHVDQDRYEEDPYIIVREQDVLITKDGTIGKVSYIDKLPGPTTLNSGIFVTRPLRDSYLPKFFYWIISSPLFTEFVNYNSSGSTILHLYQNVFERFFFPIPHLHEQKLISRYLDKKTNQIDTLIEKIQTKIELLKEQRTSLINQCVTKGLDPNVEMKDSGIEWIGEIPKHWDIKKIKYIGKVEGGSTPKSDVPEYWDGDIRWYTPTDFKYKNSMGLIESSERFISVEGLNNSGCSLVETPSVLITIRGPVGNVSIVKDEFTFNQGCKSITPENIDLDFLYFSLVIRSEVLNVLSNGTTFVELSTQTLRNFEIVYPPMDEQRKIKRYLQDRTVQISDIIDLYQEKIGLLKQYRQSLISSVVTGKIRVTEDMV